MEQLQRVEYLRIDIVSGLLQNHNRDAPLNLLRFQKNFNLRLNLLFLVLVFLLLKQIQYMQSSRLSQHSNTSTNALPQRQQWALINQQRALEYERSKSLEKVMSQQKRDTFKRQLDNQLQQKHSMRQDQKEEDRKYYDYIVSKDQVMKQKEEKDRFQKFIKSKQMQDDNRRKFQSHSNPKFQDYGKIYNLDIGRKSEEEKKQRAEAIRKDVILTLDRQREHKDASQRAEKEQNLIEYERNQEYLTHLDHRNSRDKKYEQNQNVYNYYRDLYQQKMRKDRQLQRKFVDEAQQRQSQEAIRRRQSELSLKERRNYEMRDTLEQQLQLLQRKRQEESRVNPEQANFSFISNVFRDKRPTFDKQEYSKFLERQVEEQKFNRLKQEKYMSEEEYRYNSNQLNKAINGNFTHDKYFDRSITNVGDRLNLSNIEPLQTQDADLVKTKLEVARSHHKAKIANQTTTDIGPIL